MIRLACLIAVSILSVFFLNGFNGSLLYAIPLLLGVYFGYITWGE